MNNTLLEYAKEINVELLTLEDLIKSHRRLRDMNKENHEVWRQELILAVDRAEKNAKSTALEYGWFSRERLKTMPRHCPGCSHPTICRTHGCAAVEYRRNKERKMEGPPKFNARSDAHKPRNEPGQGDDVPCVKCGGAPVERVDPTTRLAPQRGNGHDRHC